MGKIFSHFDGRIFFISGLVKNHQRVVLGFPDPKKNGSTVILFGDEESASGEEAQKTQEKLGVLKNPHKKKTFEAEKNRTV